MSTTSPFLFQQQIAGGGPVEAKSKGLADRVVRLARGRASSLTDQAIRGAVDQALNVLKIAGERVRQREPEAPAVSLSVSLSLGLVQLTMQAIVPRAVGEPDEVRVALLDETGLRGGGPTT